MSNFRISKVEVDHFRGFRNYQAFDLSQGSGLTILAGSNGFGKTSFFDAVEWAFTGELLRYNTPDEEKSKTIFISHLPSGQVGIEQEAFVRLTFGNGQHQYRLTRMVRKNAGESDYGESKTTLILEGEEIGTVKTKHGIQKFMNEILVNEVWKGKVDFKDLFGRYHILTQDKLNYFIRHCKGPQRYDQISELFGTGKYTEYDAIFSEICSEERKKLREVKEEIKLIEKELETLKDVLSVNDEINLGEYKSLEDYVVADMQNFNEKNVMLGLSFDLDSLKQYACENESLVNKSKEMVLEQKRFLHEKTLELETLIVDLNYLDNGNQEYLKNKENLEKLKSMVQLYQQVEEFEYIYNNFESYNNYTAELQKLQQQVYATYVLFENAQKRVKDNRGKIAFIKQLKYGLMDSAISEDPNNGIIKYDLDENIFKYDLSRYIEGTIKFIQSNFLKTVFDEERYLKIIKYLDDQLDKVEKLEVVLKQSTSKKQQVEEKDQLMSELDLLIRKTLDFLLAEKIPSSETVPCPLCGSKFAFSDLVQAIEDQIAEDGALMKKIVEKSRTAANNELMKRYKEEYKATVTRVVEDIDLIEQKFSALIKYDNETMEGLQAEKNTLQQQINIVSGVAEKVAQLINKYNLSITEDKISNMLRINQAKIDELHLPYVTIEDIERDLELYKEKVHNYQYNLAKVLLRTDDIEIIQVMIAQKTAELSEYRNAQNALEFLEQQLTLFYKITQNDKRQTKFRPVYRKLKQKLEEKENIVKTIEKLEQLRNGIQQVVEETNLQILNEQEELINKIFKRIFPHPFYRNLRLKFDENNHDNKVLSLECVDERNRSTINPIWTFSAAQINVVAISIFLALALQQQCTKFDTIMMDDPIQNMDDINILSFIDILRSCTSEGTTDSYQKQFVISTHDDKIYRLFMKKFRFLPTKAFAFESYTEAGPQINDVG